MLRQDIKAQTNAGEQVQRGKHPGVALFLDLIQDGTVDGFWAGQTPEEVAVVYLNDMLARSGTSFRDSLLDDNQTAELMAVRLLALFYAVLTMPLDHTGTAAPNYEQLLDDPTFCHTIGNNVRGKLRDYASNGNLTDEQYGSMRGHSVQLFPEVSAD